MAESVAGWSFPSPKLFLSLFVCTDRPLLLTLAVCRISHASSFVQIVELKKQHQAGGRSVFTWQKQPQDKYTQMIGLVLASIGIAQLSIGHYRLATGKGKIDD